MPKYLYDLFVKTSDKNPARGDDGAKQNSYEYILASNLHIGTNFVKLIALLNAPLGEVDVAEVHVPISSVICIYDEI